MTSAVPAFLHRRVVVKQPAPRPVVEPVSDSVPVFFVAKDLDAKRRPLVCGQQFPVQNRQVIRGFSEAYGLVDDGRPWSALTFVKTLVAPPDLARTILDQHLDYATAAALVRAATRRSKRGSGNGSES